MFNSGQDIIYWLHDCRKKSCFLAQLQQAFVAQERPACCSLQMQMSAGSWGSVWPWRGGLIHQMLTGAVVLSLGLHGAWHTVWATFCMKAFPGRILQEESSQWKEILKWPDHIGDNEHTCARAYVANPSPRHCTFLETKRLGMQKASWTSH